jgi:hypothetical protein
VTSTIQVFDYSVNLLRALLWQYNEAGNLQALLEEKQQWYDDNQEGFWQDFYTNIFDLRTANDFGLQVWSVILGQPLFINTPDGAGLTWGFGPEHENFTRSNFAASASATHRLNTETSRILLQLRYFQLISSGTVPETNRALKWIFEENYGKAWLNDNLDMTQFYTFQFALPSDLVFIFNNFDVLPRPAGVGSTYRVIVNKAWGFDESHANYDNGNFSQD